MRNLRRGLMLGSILSIAASAMIRNQRGSAIRKRLRRPLKKMGILKNWMNWV